MAILTDQPARSGGERFAASSDRIAVCAYRASTERGSGAIRQLSLVLAICAVPVLYSHPRVFLRIFLRNETLAVAAGVALSLVIVAVAFMALLRRGLHRTTAFLAFFLVCTLGVLSIAGMDPKFLVQMYFPYMGAIAVSTLGFREVTIRHLLRAFTVVMALNAIASFAPIDFLREGVVQHTQEGREFFRSIGDEGYRSAGFASVPGLLSLLSVMACGAGIVMYLGERRNEWLVLIVSGFLCGVGTVNRSFLVGLAVTTLAVPLLGPGRKASLKLLLPLLFAALGLFLAFEYTPYGERMTYRVSDAVLENDVGHRLYGETSPLKALQALTESPILGAAATHPITGNLVVHGSDGFVRPHNGFVQVMATRGIPLGLLFIGALMVAARRLWRVSRTYQHSEIGLLSTALLAAGIGGMSVCLSDSLTETFPMLMVLAFGLEARGLALNKRPRPAADGLSVDGRT